MFDYLATAELKREAGLAALSTGTARGMWQKVAGDKALGPPPPE